MTLPPVIRDKDKSAKKDRRKSKGVSLQGGGMMMSILELLQHIVNEPAPRLIPEGRFPNEAEDFVDSCLFKDPDARKTPQELLVCFQIPERLITLTRTLTETPMDRAGTSVEFRSRNVGEHVLSWLLTACVVYPRRACSFL
jgi:serine/threonine protein kinase